MRLGLIGAAVGVLVGVIVTLGAIEVRGGWYEYRIVHDDIELPSYINNRGWHIVPNQPNHLHIRRQRSHLP